MSSDGLSISEQLPLFEDQRALLNRGILALIRLNLYEAKKALEGYRRLYRCEDEVDTELKITPVKSMLRPCSSQMGA